MTHRRAPLLVAAVLLALLAGPLLRGEVIFAHDNRIEVGLPPEPDAPAASRKLSDHSSVFIPALHHQLRGDASGWIPTWNPHVELGRPAAHVSGFSKAFALTRALSWLSDDALVVYTWLAVAAVALTALFAYGLLAALGLHPAACAAGALWLGCGAAVLYWLTFVMLIWGVCWTLALLWAVTLFARRPTAARWLAVAASAHALLLSAYPQHVVWQAYLVCGYVILALARAGVGPRRAGLRALALAGAAAAGVASAAPVHLDLALTAIRSARLGADPAFFLEALPRLGGAGDLALYLAVLFDPFWLGNPVLDSYPVRFNGVCLTPMLASLAALSLAGGLWRRLWPAQLFVALCALTALWPALYLFGMRSLGLGLSRFDPLAAALIPLAVLAAVAADRLIRVGRPSRRAAIALAALPAAAALLGAAGSPHPLDPGRVAVGVAVVLAVLCFVWTRAPALLVATAVASALLYGLPLRLMRPTFEIHTSSPLVELLRRETAGGARFALVGPKPVAALPPNQEALFGLRSIHTYNSLSALRYQRWVERISVGGTQVLGRHFRYLDSESRLASPAFGYAGVALVLSQQRLEPRVVGRRLAPAGAGGVYRAREPPLLEAQVRRFRRKGEGAAEIPGRLREAELLPLERTLDRGDRLRFRLTEHPAETLLFVSQQHHPHWRAFAGEKPLATAVVNDFFQGVRVPPDTGEVELRFRPNVRFAWVPQLLLAAAAAALLARRVTARFASHG